ncbi:aldose 1-epimerase [Burkholderia thailandensis]|uniref:Aldose 1-epimerase family protein n=1 Tax=Burkholderia thailandensis TaxID=57975 RepID=A0AAW9D3S5_BURTH|nr:aldose 1-epimerase [Burkholderia thailandensis]AHI64299.1 aldose 1-epimerase family protein [Burkholderia thailandensis H0587]AIP64311.1 aldose epimerase [Burkholderia thailandensis]AJY30596.1 aldose 1-epimerase family protein [Burkholderia thailandensis 34]AOI52259.1 aldose epimerase [Burkholderia thailandensis]AOJ51238.1 aldose epimerase [Burkholderia thailandensis]
MPSFQNQDILELTDGASLARIAPEAGGRLLSWSIGDASIVFWPDAADWSNPAKIRGGNPLLFPFLGRHRVDGRIGFWRDGAGVVRELPMHGFARDLPFDSQADADGRGVTLSLHGSERTHAGYPFEFRFAARYRLVDEHTLDVALSTTNLGDAPLPHYPGHHFYFALPHAERASTVLELPPTRRRRQLDDGSISAPEPGSSRYTLDDPAILDRFHCLDGIPAEPVRVLMPGRRHAIEIDLNRPGSVPWYAVTTWTEAPGSNFYCIEPWLGLPDAIHNGLGLRHVAPGATETAALRIRVTPLA